MNRNEILKIDAAIGKISPALFTAITYHRTHKNERIDFINYKYLKDIYLDNSDYIVIEKSTQSGLTEWLIIKAMCKAKEGRSIFYVLPTFDLRNRFVNNRINRSIEFSPYYKNLIRESNAGISESVSLKHIGNGSIAFVGSNSPAAFSEYPADDLIIDELDHCDQENLGMADKRLSNSTHKMIIKISNPTINDYGIDWEFKKSDKKQWFIKCECGQWINPDFFSKCSEGNRRKEICIEG